MALRMNLERSESSFLTPSSRHGNSVSDTQTESSLPFRRFPTRFMTWCIYLVYKHVNKILIFFAGRKVYRICVPNQRAKGQKLLPIAVDEKFIEELDAGLARAGYRNRSQFIRDAIVEKLKRACIVMPKELAL